MRVAVSVLFCFLKPKCLITSRAAHDPLLPVPFQSSLISSTVMQRCFHSDPRGVGKQSTAKPHFLCCVTARFVRKLGSSVRPWSWKFYHVLILLHAVSLENREFVTLCNVMLSFMAVINKHIYIKINLSAGRCTVQFTGCLTLACCPLCELCTFISQCI